MVKKSLILAGCLSLTLFVFLSLRPAAAEENKVLKNEKDGSLMVLIPGGEFTMGSNGGYPDSRPAHKVKLKAFYIDKYEITNSQYQKFIKETGRGIPKNRINPKYDLWAEDGTFPPEIANQPVVNISWEDALAYAKWAGKRLPTEAEWEKAARGTDDRAYPWGNEPPDAKKANFAREWKGKETFSDVTAHPEGASPYGVYNMAGNAAEWVADWYDQNYYKEAPRENPPGPPSGAYRVIRGGAYANPEFYLRCSDRDLDMPDDQCCGVGFRCAREQ